MPLTTSYFAVSRNLRGTKISIARFHQPWIRNGIDEIMEEFSPSTNLLRFYKSQEINWGEFKKKYFNEQKKHYKEHPENFENLLERAEEENIILLCYERFEGRVTRCHRFLLYKFLNNIAKKEGYNVDFIDELPYEKMKK